MIKIMKYGQVPNSEIFSRVVPTAKVEDVVSAILSDVRSNGDRAVLSYTQKFDGAELTALEVSREEIQEAFDTVEPEFLDILKEAAENIRAFHGKQVRNSFILAERPGIVLGQRNHSIHLNKYQDAPLRTHPSSALIPWIGCVFIWKKYRMGAS